MWKLQEESGNKRSFANSVTGSQCSQTMCYVDKDGNKWWHFDDLTSMPYTRQFAAAKISSLYALGLSKEDLSNHISGLKTILKSDDKEKYEKAFANILEFENKANNATDAVKQMSSLVCVYFTMNDEPIDSFDNALQIKKMSMIGADIDMHSFFLNLQTDTIQQYTEHLKLISKTAFQPMAE
jgi:hypothetical protein